MTTDRPPPPEPLLAAIREEAARIRQEGVEADLDDPALLELVERAVAAYEPVLTAEGRDDARRVAALALATHPDIENVLDRIRAGQETGGSGVRPTRSPARLEEIARRRRRGA